MLYLTEKNFHTNLRVEIVLLKTVVLLDSVATIPANIHSNKNNPSLP